RLYNFQSTGDNGDCPATPNDHTERTYRSDHPGGVNFALLDGSVRFLVTETAPLVRRALVTRAGQEVVSSNTAF
ncbi:MAG: H-X9-DG-CTERM domain-containing protein, partial [Planctomycetota bacterium]